MSKSKFHLMEKSSRLELYLQAFSPGYNVAQLKVPVVLIHGTADERTPISQAESLVEALENKKHSHKTLFIDNEYHGFVDEGNRLKAFRAIIEFLNEHIGS